MSSSGIEVQKGMINGNSTIIDKWIYVCLIILSLACEQAHVGAQATCINKFYGCINLRVIFQSAHRIKSFFPYKDRINRSQMSKVVYKASCWD